MDYSISKIKLCQCAEKEKIPSQMRYAYSDFLLQLNIPINFNHENFQFQCAEGTHDLFEILVKKIKQSS